MHIVPLRELDGRTFESALAVQQRDEVAADPAVPPVTAPELRRLALHDRMEGNRHERHVVLEGDDARALVHLEFELDDANTHRANVEIFGVTDDPEAATFGLRDAIDRAENDGRTMLTGWGPTTEEHDRFWTDAGASLNYREKISALDMEAVDRARMDEWIADGARRAADVEIIRWVDRCPDQYMDPWVESLLAMNDMPIEGLDVNAWTVDEEHVRADEENLRQLGLRVRSMLAVDADGRAAAHTRVHVNPSRPSASYQWDTAVVDRHRGRGIGKWIKAEMWRWLRAEEPAATRLTTGNAQSNDAMLAINVAMGYEPIIESGAWEAPIDAMRARLG